MFFGLFSLAQSKNNTKPFIVVLDAGHGGKDPGHSTSFGYKEKDIALDIVLRVGKQLENIDDVEVIYTRTEFFWNFVMCSYCQQADADLLSLSIVMHTTHKPMELKPMFRLHRNDSNFRSTARE